MPAASWLIVTDSTQKMHTLRLACWAMRISDRLLERGSWGKVRFEVRWIVLLIPSMGKMLLRFLAFMLPDACLLAPTGVAELRVCD